MSLQGNIKNKSINFIKSHAANKTESKAWTSNDAGKKKRQDNDDQCEVFAANKAVGEDKESDGDIVNILDPLSILAERLNIFPYKFIIIITLLPN